jgi:CBS domain-containing protein
VFRSNFYHSYVQNKLGCTLKTGSKIALRRLSNLKVRDIMTKDVASLETSSTVAEAAKLMQRLNVGAVPVCEKGGVVGMVTDRIS